MKRPLQLPLAIALALGATNAFALGLGTIHVNSKLNQPLDAEIPVLQGTQGEAEGLLVQLAAAEDFDRVGLNRSRLSVPLEFTLVKSPHGEMVIKVTSKEVVREPFLDFLVEANWPKGRLLREYTVLLDPPVMAPATGATSVAQAPKTQQRAPAPAPAEKPKAAPPPKSAPVAAAPRPEKPAPAPTPKAAPAAPAPKAAGSNEYTVQEGDTLSAIAREVKQDDATNINQLMLALLKQNPNAFYKDNINALKRGAILRIPSADQVKAVGSASEAAAMVHSQIEDWRGGAAAKPTLVADTGAAPEPKTKPPAAKPAGSASTTTKSGTERLELVPPKAGKESVAMNDRPGSGAGSGNAQSGELKSELARTKEALTAREQEAGELKSRVKELEDTKSKSDRLITLKDSEIADLQKKLKDLQDAAKSGAKTSAATTPAPVATSPPATTTPSTTPSTAGKVSKEDIWGKNGAAPTDSKSPAATSTPSATGTGSTASSTTPATTPPASPPATTTPATVGSTTPPSATGASSGNGTATSSGGTTTPSMPTASTPSGTTPSGTTPSSTPAASTPPASTTATTPAKPAVTTAPVKTAKTTTQSLPPNAPAWYDQAWVKPAAIGAAALLLLAGLLSMRRRKAAAATVERGSIAGAFGESPLRDDGGAGALTAAGEEAALREQIEQDPSNLGLHLELLSLFYAERNAGAFEDAAETMHLHVTDPLQPEWLEAKAMGQELAPHNALFAEGAAAMSAFDDEAITAPHATATPFDEDDVFASHHEPIAAHDESLAPHYEAPPAAHANTAFDFDLDADAPKAAPATTEPPFAFDNLPPIDFGREAEHEFEAAAPAPAPLHVDEDEFAGEDGVGTKLDLAKAYLDMGDPEGARSMLEEVLSEGTDSQKGEARRLMAEIR